MKHIFLILCITAGLTGCSTNSTSTSIKAEGAIITTVDAGMKAWAAYANSGKATTTQINNVENAYNAYYTAQLAAASALETIVTSGSTNTVDIATVNASVTTAEGQLLSMLNSYIFK